MLKWILCFSFFAVQSWSETIDLKGIAKATLEKALVLEAALEAKGDKNPPAPVNMQSSSYRYFQRAFEAALANEKMELEEVLRLTELPETVRKTYVSLDPKDAKRPGIIVTFDAATATEVDGVVGELRNATTTAILAKKLFASKQDLMQGRANSYLIIKADKELNQGIRRAQSQLENLSFLLANLALDKALREAGSGRWRSAEQRLAVAISGGIGGRALQQGLSQGLTNAKRLGAALKEDLMQVIALHTRAKAFEEAGEVQARAIEVGKPLDLIGFELDLRDVRKIGIEYTVSTTEGRTYWVKHLGKNFEDPKGPSVPARVYAKLNQSLQSLYDKHHDLTDEMVLGVFARLQFRAGANGEYTYQP